jgi:hypothetical protein
MDTTSTFDYRQFHQLGDPFARQALRLELAPDSKWMDPSKASDLAWGRLAATEEVLRLRGYMGGQPRDFLWSGFPPLVCVSQRVVSLLEENGFSGWSTYPVEVCDRRGLRLPDYGGFAVIGRGGRFIPALSKKVARSQPRGTPYEVYVGKYFDPAAWDGSDIFRVQGSIVVIEKVAKKLKRSKVTNIRLTPIPEVEIPAVLYEE